MSDQGERITALELPEDLAATLDAAHALSDIRWLRARLAEVIAQSDPTQTPEAAFDALNEAHGSLITATRALHRAAGYHATGGHL